MHVFIYNFHYRVSDPPLLSFVEADTITNNFLTLMADTDKITNNRNIFMLSLCTPECKQQWWFI